MSEEVNQEVKDELRSYGLPDDTPIEYARRGMRIFRLTLWGLLIFSLVMATATFVW